MTSHGYSGKPLSEKLGIKAGMRCALLHAPEGFAAASLADLPSGASLTDAPPAEIALLFVTETAVLSSEFPALGETAPTGGALWVVWPKKTSKKATDLTDNRVREVCLPTGWVDVKVCAVDETWSGLKFLRRKS